MRQHVNAGTIMIRSDADLPYINQVLTAHPATKIAYRTGPAHTVQLIVPSAPLPSPQSAVVRTLRSTRLGLNASSNFCTLYRRVESTGTEAGSETTKAEDAEIGHDEIQTSSHVGHGEELYLQSQVRVGHEEDRPRDRGFRATDFDGSNNEDTLCDDEDDKDVAPIVVRTHRGLCAADFDNSDGEDSLCDDDDIRGLDLEAHPRCSRRNKELEIPEEHQLTTVQLRVQEIVLRKIARQALKARRDGRIESNIFSDEAPEEDDWVLEMILAAMGSGHNMTDAGQIEGEEGLDIQMMVRNNFHTLMRKATRRFRPSGISVAKTELTQCLAAFRQMRSKLLQENGGMSMAEILEEKSLDLRPRVHAFTFL